MVVVFVRPAAISTTIRIDAIGDPVGNQVSLCKDFDRGCMFTGAISLIESAELILMIIDPTLTAGTMLMFVLRIPLLSVFTGVVWICVIPSLVYCLSLFLVVFVPSIRSFADF
jgi:hypothetical protein